MVTDYVTPMDKTYALLGQPKVSLQQGVDETPHPTRIHFLTPPTLRSVSAVAAGLARGLQERGCSAGAADTLQLD